MTRMIWLVPAAALVILLALPPTIHAEEAPPAAPAAATSAPVTAPAKTPETVPVKAEAAPPPEPAKAPEAAAPAPPAPRTREFRFQFDGMSYADVIRRFTQLSGKPLLGDIKVEGNVTFFDPKAYTYEDAFDTLNLLLAMKGFALVERPRYMEVVAIKDAPRSNEILQGWAAIDKQPPRPGEIVTMLVPLKSMMPEDAVKLLTPVVSTYGNVAALGRARGIIITDRMENITRIRGLLGDLDQPSLSPDRQLKSYKLEHASARDLANVITNLFGPGGPSVMQAYMQAVRRAEDSGNADKVPEYSAFVQSTATPDIIKATADDRTNTLFLVGPGEKLAMAEEVIRQLDGIEESKTGEMRIFKLSKARAEDVANIIRQALPPAGAPANAGGRFAMPTITPTIQTRVVADSVTNSVIVSAPLDQMKRVEEIINELDKGGPDGTIVSGVKIFRLEVADAQQLAGPIANAIRRTEADPQNRRGQQSQAQVSAHVPTNSLIVSGTAGEIQAAAALIQEFDKPAKGKEPYEIHVLQLKGGDARQIANSINQLLRQQGTGQGGNQAAGARVEAEPTTNSLMVRAAPGDWETIKTIIEQIKVEVVQQITPSTRLITIEYAKALDVADTLRQVYSNQARSRQGEKNFVPVVISANERSNTILISAAEDDQKAIAELVKVMDVPSSEEKVDPVRIVSVKAGDAVKIADTLKAMQPPARGNQLQRIFISGDAASNSVVIRAPDSEFKALSDMVASLDKAITTTGTIKVFPLKVADAQQVAQVLQAALTRPAAGNRAAAAPPTVVSSDARTNSVIVAGPAGDIQTAATLIQEIDQTPPTGAERREVHVVQLKGGDAKQLADAITKVITPPAAPGVNRAATSPGVRVEADPATNSLLISAAPGDWPMVEKILTDLQAKGPPPTTAVTKLIPLKNARASELAGTLRQVYTGQGNRPRTPNGQQPVPVVIAPSDQTNSLLISASEDDHKDIAQLIKTMDVPFDEKLSTVQVRTYHVEASKAVDLAASLNRLFAQQQQQRPAAPGTAPEAPPRFEADAATNTVMVSATAAQFQIIDGLIKQLDNGGAGTRETRAYRLKVVKATDLVDLLQTMLLDTPVVAGRNQPAATTVDVRVAAMTETNEIVIQGPPGKLTMAEELIKEFDRAGGNQASTQIVQLKNAQAATLADAITLMLAGQAAPRTGANRPPAPGAATVDRVTVTPEPNSNSVLVRGPAADVPGVVDMIKQLDGQSTTNGLQVRIFPLTAGDPTALAATLGKFFQDIQTKQQQSNKNATPQPFSVTADERTKSLVVSTTPANFTIFEQILKNLDLPPTASGLDVQIWPIANGDPKAIAGQITDMYRDRRGVDKPVVSYDEFSSSVTVIAKSEDLKAIEQVISKLEKAAEDTSYGYRVIQLSPSLKAEKVAEVLKAVYSQVNRNDVTVTDQTPSAVKPPADGAVPAPELPKQSPPAKTEPAAAPPAAKDKASEKLAPPAREGGALFRAPGNPGVTIAVEKGSNALIVSGKRQDIDYIESLISQLKTGLSSSEAIYRRFEIKQSDPVSVARMLDALFNPRIVLPPQQGNNPAPLPPLPPPVITVVADPRTKSVIVRAKPLDFELIEPLIIELDKVATDGVVSDLRTFHLVNTDATEVATNLKDLFQTAQQAAGQPAQPQPNQPGQGNPRQQRADLIRQMIELRSAAGVTQVDVSAGVTISANRQTNSVIVAAPSDAMSIIAKIIEELDQSGKDSAPTVRFYPIKNGDVRTIVTALQDLTAAGSSVSRPAGRTAQGQPQAGSPGAVTVTGDEAGRLIVVSAPAEKQELVAKVIEEMDKAPGLEQAVVKVYHLQTADAQTVALALATTVDRTPAGQPAGRNAQAGSGGLIRVSADRSSNCVVVRAPAADHERIAKIISEMDAAPAPTVKVYRLQNAEVRAAVAVLQDMFSAGTRSGQGNRNQAAGSSAGAVVISGDEAGRLIFVSAPAEKHELAATVIKQMDDAEATDQAVIKIYPLKSADATTVAQALSATVDRTPAGQPAGRNAPGAATGLIRISAERSSNSVVVRAPPADHERIAKYISEMDVAIADTYAPKLIPITNGDVTNIAQMLSRVFNPAAAQGSRAGGPSGQGPRPNIVIEADRDARMLTVRADDATFEKIKAMAQQLDQASQAGQVTTTVLPLKFAQAASVAPALSQAFTPAPGGGGPRATINADDRVTVVAEPNSNHIIVTASAKNLEKVKTLLEKLDTEQAGGVKTELVILLKAKAVDVAPVLSRMAAGSAYTGGRASGIAGFTMPSIVSADAGSNSLVITGPSVDIDKIVKMAKQLDEANTVGGTSTFVVSLKNGDAATVAQMVRDLYQQQAQAAARDRKTIDALAVTSDARSNAVVLSTTKEMYEQVSQWVGQIETMTSPRGTVRIIKLENADPAELDKAIKQLFPQGTGGSVLPVRRGAGGPAGAEGAPQGPAPTGGGKVESTVLPQQRSVLVNASDEDFETIKKVAEAMEKAAIEGRRMVQVFPLKNVSNSRIAAALTAMYRAVPGRAGQPVAPEDVVTVTALPDSNSLVVSASKVKMEEVAHLIEQLDTATVAPALEFRIITLQNTQPTKIMPLLLPAIAQLRLTRPDEQINVQANERTRSIIVTARPQMFEQIEKLVATLDKAPDVPAVDMVVLPLKKADATRLATVLTEMLRPSAGGGATPEALALQEQVRLLRIKTREGKDLPELDLTKPIKVSADPSLPGIQGSNSLLITSTPENLKAMKAVVELLDVVPVGEGVRVRLLHLQNADAVAVVTVLREIFTQGARMGGKPGTSVAGRAEPETAVGKGLVTPFNVSSDDRTNTLVMSGAEESLALAELVVKDLDRDAAKIVTEVRLFRLKNADVTKLVPVLQAVFAETANAAPGTEGLKTYVTRLRTVMDKAQGHVTDIPKTRAALTIQADPATSILIVAARADVMPLLADVIQTMDVPGAGSMNAVRIYPLVNADAPRLKTVIDGLYTGPNQTLVRIEDKPVVQVDLRTNALVVSASDKTFAMIETMLKRLDAKQDVVTSPIRLTTLKNADASGLAPVLQRMMDARVQRAQQIGSADAEALRVTISADNRSNSLMVAGSPEGLDLVKSLAEQLDNAAPALTGEIQLMPLKNANAGAVSASLTNLFTQRYAAARTTDVQRQRPIILPDVRVNALLVAANADDTKVILGLLAKLDVELQNPSVQLVVIPMKFNDAGVVGPMIQQIFTARLTSMTLPGQTAIPQDRVDVAADSLSNSLIISASAENLKLIQGLLDKVDVLQDDVSGIVRMYPLQNSDAQRIATLLQGLITQGLYKPGAVLARNNPVLAAREKVAITFDARTNVLIVSASQENFTVIEEIIKKLDSSDDFAIMGDVQLFTLKNANATRLAPVLQQLFTAKRAGEVAAGAGTGRSLPVSVFADARTNTLLVTGSKESFKAVEEMIKTLDTDQVLAANEFQIFYLSNATAAVVQPTLTQLFAQRASRDPQKDPVTIVAEPRTNALIVAATPEDMKLAESLIKRLDAEADRPGTSVQVFPLVRADATAVAKNINDVYKVPGATAAGSPTVVVSVDERSNAVIVSAGPGDLKRIAELIQKIDGDSVPSITEIRVFTLENADASELATILISSMNNKPPALTTTSPNRQEMLQFISQTKEGEKLISSALKEGVLITADKRTNSLVVSAPLESMPLLESLIKSMDSITPRAAEIRVIALENADARQTVTVLQQLFRMTASGTGAVGAVSGPATRQAANYMLKTPATGDAGPSAPVGTADDQVLAVTVDVRTNSLLIGGTKRYVDLAAKVAQELDASTAAERVTELYRLRNAQAADIQKAVADFLKQEQGYLTTAMGAGFGTSQFILDREVAIVAEPVTNTLLLSASPRYFDVIDEMIRQLDQPPPQVLIQVLLAEVSVNDTTDLGIDWNLRGTFGGSDIFAGSNMGTQGLFKSTSAGISAGPLGFSVAATGGNIQYFLRALEAQGHVEILSRPQILASDNQKATINVGQRVPFITNSQVNDTGTIYNTIQYQPIGIILNVTPRINPDGFVKLVVDPEISSVSDSSVTVSPGVNAIIINSRTADTTVTVQDGHTIVIGGLITTNDQNVEDKVPFFGDLPGIGFLFKSTHKVKERTELLIILTPTVIRNVPEADATTSGQTKRLNLLRQIKHDEIQKSIFQPLDGSEAEKQAPGDSSVVEPASDNATPIPPPAAGRERVGKIMPPMRKRSELDVSPAPGQNAVSPAATGAPEEEPK